MNIKNLLTSVIPMTFHVPVRVYIIRLVLFITANFDLFETPLRQNCICGAKVTPKSVMAEAQTSSQGMYPVDSVFASPYDIVYYFNTPVVVHIADCGISVARYLVV